MGVMAERYQQYPSMNFVHLISIWLPANDDAATRPMLQP